MKKTALLLAVAMVVAVVAFPATAMAVKPDANLAAAQHVDWNLSGAVMPSPPWGQHDIVGSDVASKLIVNQPNGAIEVAMTGAMNGLAPNTEYTVFISNAWTTFQRWNVVGLWDIRFLLGAGIYDHDMTVTFEDMYTGAFSGSGTNGTVVWPIGPTSVVTLGDTIALDIHYPSSTYAVHATAPINADGSIGVGNWAGPGQAGTWFSTGGHAVRETVGAGFPQLFPGQSTFTFMTDEFGAASWHINLRDADVPAGESKLSVWINGGDATVLISDNFAVTK